MYNRLRPLLLLTALAAAPLASAGPGAWTSAGPEGGSVVDLAVDPASPSTVFLGATTGIYKSTNTGTSWTMLNVAPYAATLNRLRMSPHDSDVLMVTSYTQIFRSTDGGANWAPLAGGLPAPGEFLELAFDPTTPGRVWAAGGESLWRSEDDGQTWTALPATGLGDYARVLIADPHVAGRLVAHADGGLYRSTDAGATWTASTGLPPNLSYSNAMDFTATPGVVLFGSTQSEVFRSVDGGASFASLGAVGLPHVSGIRHIQAHPTNGNTWWLGVGTGLVRTSDGGVSYTVVGQGIRPVAGGSHDNGVNAVFVRPDDTNTLYAGADFTGFYVSSNGGTSWTRRNSGLRQSAIRALAVHPAQPQWVYAGYGDALSTPSDGLFRSVDRGATWFSASPTLEASGLRTLLIDPNTSADPFSTTMYAAGYGNPLLSLSGTVRDGNGGIFKSSNGGATWSTIDNGIPDYVQAGYRRSYFTTSRSVVADPASGGAPGVAGPLQTLYLAGSGTIQYDGTTGTPTVRAARIYKSTDAGANWTASDTGLPVPLFNTATFRVDHVQAVPLAVDPSNPSTLYVGTFTNAYDPPYFNPLVSRGVINGVFKSTDGGATWVHSSSGLPRLNPADPDSATRSVFALVLAPSLPSRLYVATHNLMGDSVVYRSDDAGATWFEANDGIAAAADIRAMVVDPTDADVVYAGATGSETNPGGVYRTVDGGVTWTSYSVGLPTSAASALELDLSGAIPRLYAGTRHGVFSIDQVPDEDADGVPSSIESAAPSAGDGNGDGIPDTLQAHVASLQEAGDGIRTGGTYVSIEVEALSGACARLENTHALPATAFPVDPQHDYPFGLVRLDLPACTQARLHLRFHGGSFDPAWRFRVFAPLTPDQPHTYAWRDLPFVRDGDTWTITLTDNQLGDLRSSDNAILFQGGVAVSEILFANGFEQP